MKPMELRPTGLIIGFADLVNAGLAPAMPTALRAYFDSAVVVEDMQLEMRERDPDGTVTRLLNEWHRRYGPMLKSRPPGRRSDDFVLIGSYLDWIKRRPVPDRTAPVLDDSMTPAIQKGDTVTLNHWLPEDGEPVGFLYPDDARVRFGYYCGDHLERADGSTIVATDQVKIVGVAVTVISRPLKPRVTEQE